MPDLNPQQFYHGSNRSFSPGDSLRPPSETGNTFWGQQHPEDMDRVYAVGTHEVKNPEAQELVADEMPYMADRPHHEQAERMAWHYATQRPKRGEQHRSAVYEVEGKFKTPETADAPGEVYAPNALVRRRVDIAPGAQGTFPQVNWNDHAKNLSTHMTGGSHAYGPEVYGAAVDYNHPVDKPYVPPEERMNLGKDPEGEKRAMNLFNAQRDPNQPKLF